MSEDMEFRMREGQKAIVRQIEEQKRRQFGMDFGMAEMKIEGEAIFPGVPPRPPVSPWSAFWTEVRKRLSAAWWALKGDGGAW